MSIQQILYAIIVRIPAVLLALSVHEAAHGWMAYKLGDPTAKMMGRVTLNPIRHFDLFGTLSMLLVGFGWAKPVPFNPHNFKRFRSGSAMVALAGPVSNFFDGDCRIHSVSFHDDNIAAESRQLCKVIFRLRIKLYLIWRKCFLR